MVILLRSILSTFSKTAGGPEQMQHFCPMRRG
jgi:hypothetical protein